MEKSNMMKKVLGGLLVGGLLLGGTGLALASNETGGQSPVQKLVQGFHGARMGNMDSEASRSVLDSLVSAGTLSQEQADKIRALAEQKETERENRRTEMANMTREERQAERQEIREDRVGIWEQLIADNTITQEQLDAIRDGFQAENHEQRVANLETALKALVDKGIIDNDESAAIKSKVTAFEAERQAGVQARADMTVEERQAERDKIRNMTAEERQAYMRANRQGINNPIDQLVSEGVLTQAQATAVKQAISPIQGQGVNQGPGKMGGRMMGPGSCINPGQ